MPAGLYIEAHLFSYHSVIRPAVCATHGKCLSYVMDVALSDYDVVDQMPNVLSVHASMFCTLSLVFVMDDKLKFSTHC